MSAVVKLSSALPGDNDTNGLDDLADELVADPATIRVSIAWHDVAKIVDDTDEGTRVPYVRIRRIECLGLAKDIGDQIRALVQNATEARTGRKPLPFDAPEPYEVEAE